MKKLLIYLFTSAIFFISCEEQNSTIDEVVGVWYMPQSLNRVTANRSIDELGRSSLNAWNYSTVITTNSNQSFIDQMSEAKGSISISGFISGELKFMQGWLDYNDESSSVFVTNRNWMSMFDGPSQNDDPFISLSLNDYVVNENFIPVDSSYYGFDDDFFSAQMNNGTYFDIVQNIDYAYDGKTLTVPDQELLTFQDSILTIGGTLSHALIDLQANSPTKIMSYDGDMNWDYGSWEIHIKDDGKWVEVYTFEAQNSSDGWSNIYADSTIAEWEIRDDVIVVTYRYDDIWPDAGGNPGIGQGTWLYQVAYTFEIKNDNLKLLNEFDMCEFEEDLCLGMFERQYGLDNGSLESIKMVWQLEFSKDPSLRKRTTYQESIRKSLTRHSARSFNR